MAQTNIICICCPKGCHITVEHDDNKNILSVSGFTCPRGEEYAHDEFTNPTRVFTSTVRVKGGDLDLLPVKTNGVIPKPMMMDAARESCRIDVTAPIKIGDVIQSDFCGTGVDLVAARSIKAV